MKVGQLIEQLAALPSYFEVRVEAHGGEFGIEEVGNAGGCIACVGLVDIDGYNLTPEEPNEEMLIAALEECHVPSILARNVWKAMHAAVDD